MRNGLGEKYHSLLKDRLVIFLIGLLRENSGVKKILYQLKKAGSSLLLNKDF